MMTPHEQMLAILEGRSPDRIPWIPRLQLWYESCRRQGTLPERYRGWSLRQIEQDMGMGTPARDGRVFRTEIRGVDVRRRARGSETLIEYVTPVGAVSSRHLNSSELELVGITGQEVEHLIKGPDDYAPVEFLIEHTAVIPTYGQYLSYEATIGDAGFPIVPMGQDPMNQILQELIGYNKAFFHLYDYANRVEHLLGVLEEKAAEIQEVALDSPGKLFLYGEHFDSQMTPPHLFAKYMLPHFQPFAERLHARGRWLACHADADTSLLLHLIKEAGFDMAECFVTAPMVPVTLGQARSVFGSDVIIWGGIPSVLLCDPVTDQTFEGYMSDLFRTIAPGDAFVLGVADNVMPEAKLERLRQVSDMVEAYGLYPIQKDGH